MDDVTVRPKFEERRHLQGIEDDGLNADELRKHHPGYNFVETDSLSRSFNYWTGAEDAGSTTVVLFRPRNVVQPAASTAASEVEQQPAIEITARPSIGWLGFWLLARGPQARYRPLGAS